MKSQISVEFLMVIGFSLLTILAIFSVLALNGLPSHEVPSMCIFPAGFDCIDKPAISESDIVLALKNQMSNIEVLDIKTDCKQGSISQISVEKGPYTNLPVSVPAGANIRLRYDCGNLKKGQRFKSRITVDYINLDSSLENSFSGSIQGLVA